MKTIINKISEDFLKEAKFSPKMLEDLAAMEKYMSESYDGRTFIELLQNADDAKAKRVVAFTIEDTLIVANDGRKFNDEDIVSICRSGASNKQRGENIGYRGVGFKSATTLSTEIIIHSAEIYFTFSKSMCAKRLGMQVNDVPTVRIPFLYNEQYLSKNIQSALTTYKSIGFTTFFIFKDANINKFLGELQTFDEGWLLFLQSINEVKINCLSFKTNCKITRKQIKNHSYIVEIPRNEKQWYIFTDDIVSIAFRYDIVKGIVPCENAEAVFHCFLPTLDKTGFPLKINGDFSTDPSRKHIILDDITKGLLDCVQNLYIECIKQVAYTKEVLLYQIISLLTNHTMLSTLASQFENGLLDKLQKNSWVLLNNGELVYPSKVKLFYQWIEHDDRVSILKINPKLKSCTLSEEWLIFIDKIDTFLLGLGGAKINIRDLTKMITQVKNVEQLSINLLAKIFVYSKRCLFQEEKLLEKVLIPTDLGFIQLSDINRDFKVNEEYIDCIKNLFNMKEIDTIIKKYPVFGKLPKKKSDKKSKSQISQNINLSSIVTQKQLIINSWKTPIQNCITLENLAGFTTQNVEKKTTEYSIISSSSDGENFYIAVKSVKTLEEPFSLTESEYEAAKKYGRHYKIYLFATTENGLDYSIINNPIMTVPMRCIVKEWEWICNDYLTPDTTPTSRIESPSNLELNVNFDDMDGIQFEKFCKKLLIKNGYENISMTAISGDQGVDIIAYRDRVKYGIQCKCYSSNVGNSAIQEIYAGKTFYKCHVGIVMTNQKFTQSAIELAESNGIILWDRDMILKLIKNAI